MKKQKTKNTTDVMMSSARKQMAKKKIDVLKRADVKKAEKLRKALDVCEGAIIDRINYVIQTIFRVYKHKLDCWYFYNAAEGETGDLWKNLIEGKDPALSYVDYCTDPYYGMVFLAADGNSWELDNSFPMRWLFEDFEEELAEGRKRAIKKRSE